MIGKIRNKLKRTSKKVMLTWAIVLVWAISVVGVATNSSLPIGLPVIGANLLVVMELCRYRRVIALLGTRVSTAIWRNGAFLFLIFPLLIGILGLVGGIGSNHPIEGLLVCCLMLGVTDLRFKTRVYTKYKRVLSVVTLVIGMYCFCVMAISVQSQYTGTTIPAATVTEPKESPNPSLEEKDISYDGLEERVATLEKENVALSKEISVSTEKIDGYETEIEKLTISYKELKGSYDELEKLYKELSQKFSDVTELLETAKAEYETELTALVNRTVPDDVEIITWDVPIETERETEPEYTEWDKPVFPEPSETEPPIPETQVPETEIQPVYDPEVPEDETPIVIVTDPIEVTLPGTETEPETEADPINKGEPVEETPKMEVTNITVIAIDDSGFEGDTLSYNVSAEGTAVDITKLVVSMGSISESGIWQFAAPAESGTATISYGDVSITVEYTVNKFETETEPETGAPETEAPETESPETGAPETEAPETESPETGAPETEAPETGAPETEAPETEAPETETPGILTGVYLYDLSVICGSDIQGDIAYTGDVDWSQVYVSGLEGLSYEIYDGTITIHTSEVASDYYFTVSYNGSSVYGSFSVQGVGGETEVIW